MRTAAQAAGARGAGLRGPGRGGTQADPKNTTLANQANTLFKGETLRGLLLNAYGWSRVAMYLFFAAIGLTIAAFAVLATLVFEVLVAPRRVEATRPHPIPA